MHFRSFAAAAFSAPLLFTGAVGAQTATGAQPSGPDTILVLDASGSMWGQIDGVNKIVIARQVVGEILRDFPAERNLGLVTYGHRVRGECSDIETLVAPGPGTAGRISEMVNGLNPRGMTPMTDSIIAAAEALRFTERAATVILVSDGIETCNPDPCAAARALAETGVDFTAHVVGFDVAGEAQALLQMQCIAEATGGMFLTADNAEELTAALETVVAAEPEPEPEPALASVTLRAVLDSENGPLIADPVIWSLGAYEFGMEAEENPASVELQAGAYTITGYHVVFEQEVSVQASIVAGMDRTINVVFQTPAPTASLTAPESAPAGSVIEVAWVGPNAQSDSVEIAVPGERYYSYGYTARSNPVRIQLPADPGTYELRYRLHDQTTIATRPITVTPIEIGLMAPESAPAGSVIEVAWQGPNAQSDNIEIALPGGNYLHFTYTDRGNPVQLQLPAQPGTYELRYRFRDQQTIATRPITVTEREVSLMAPESAPAGSIVEVAWVGPDAQSDNIQVATPDGNYYSYAYTERGNPARIQLPADPGTYELRYSFRDQGTIATRPITVTPITLALVAPDTAVAGSTIEVGFTGPNAPSDNIQVAHVGGGYINYTYTDRGNPARLVMPDQPGTYELRYQFRDSQTIITRPITVTGR